MKKYILRIIALILCAAMLSGCDLETVREEMWNYLYRQSVPDVTRFEDMVYNRPDMEALEQSITDACETAAGENLEEIVDAIYAFYDVYDAFYTNYMLADIHYCHDLTDAYWEEEYNFCAENSGTVDAALEELYYALEKSPCRAELESEEYFGEGYFDSYEGENHWDEEFVALLTQESELQSKYYELTSLGQQYDDTTEEFYTQCGNEMMELLVELIALRQEIAAYVGYESYADFAWDYYHSRDYTPAQTRVYVDRIRDELVPLYRQAAGESYWDAFDRCTSAQTFDYARTMARNMGGTVEEAFELLEAGALYDIAPGANKYESSFEVYLDTYWQPFIFMNPTNCTYDHLTFAHEFGHFCNDYAAYGSYAGTDVSEFFSQGMEYLSLCYGEASDHLTKMKMADSLCMYVEQAAYADFEMRMYDIPVEELTVDALLALYKEVGTGYGFDSFGYDPREFVTVNHYFTNPLYIMSYVVSNDAAMQLYQLEQENPGQGLAKFEENLTTEEYYFLSFLDAAGLQSPFAEGRLQEVRATFEEILG